MEVLAGRKQDAVVLSIRPINNPAADAHGTGCGAVSKRIETPQLTSGHGIERQQLRLRRGAVEHTVDDERVALDL